MDAHPHPPTVLIDVDGTISDSLPGIRAGFLAGLAAVAEPVPEESFLARIAGPPMVDSFAALGITGDRARRALAAYRAQQAAGGWADTRMFDGWPGLLDGWRAAGFRIATATSKGGVFTRRVLARFGILDRFDAIGAADDAGDRRAKDEVIGHTLRMLGLPAVRRAGYRPDDPDAAGGAGPGGSALPGVVLVGDRSHDFAGAHVFGLPAVAVGWGYGDAAERARADALAADAAALDAAVRRLLAGAG